MISRENNRRREDALPKREAAQALLPFNGFSQSTKEFLAALKYRFPIDQWIVFRIENNRLQILQIAGTNPINQVGEAFDIQSSIIAPICEQEVPLYCADTFNHPEISQFPQIQAANIQAYLSAPLLKSNGDLIGFLFGHSTTPNPEFTADNHQVITISARMMATFLQTELRDVQDTRRLERAETEAMMDELTGIYNRRGWERFLLSEDIRGRRYGATMGIIIADANNLKVVNDQYGHAAGDQMLQAIANILKDTVRTQDIVARIGGDEFAILCLDTSEDALMLLSDRILHAVKQAGHSVSIGASVHEATHSISQTLQKADELMYIHKRKQKAKISTDNLPH